MAPPPRAAPAAASKVGAGGIPRQPEPIDLRVRTTIFLRGPNRLRAGKSEIAASTTAAGRSRQPGHSLRTGRSETQADPSSGERAARAAGAAFLLFAACPS